MSHAISEIEIGLSQKLDSADRIRLMNNQAFELLQTRPRRALELAEEAQELSVECCDLDGQARSLRTIAMCYDSLSEYENAMGYVRRAHTLFEKLGNGFGVANSMITEGIIARGMSNYSLALTCFKTALASFEELDDKSRIASAWNNIGTIHNGISNYTEALNAYLKALGLYEEIGEEGAVAIITSNIAIIYYYLEDYDRSFEWHTRGLAVFRKHGNLLSEALALGNLSSIHKIRKEYEKGQTNLRSAIEILREIGERRYEAANRTKLGMLLDILGQHSEALEEFQTAIAIATEIGNLDCFCDGQLRLGEHYRLLHEYPAAIVSFKEALRVANEKQMDKDAADINLSLALALESVGEASEALVCIKEHARLREKVFGTERQRAVAEMQARFDVEHAEREREIFRLKSEHLEEMMEQRSKELTSLAMQLMQKNTFLQKLRKDTQSLLQHYPEAKQSFNGMLIGIAENLHDDDWQRFEQEFQHVHAGFVQVLSARYPRLTPTELKVCALLKINLSNKDIMRLLSVSVRNVESHRYSIRKKMGIPSNINLSAYLAGLSA